MTTVFIEKKDGEWANENFFSSMIGFKNKGYEIVPFIFEQMLDKELPLTKETIVHGNVNSVLEALRQINVSLPKTFDLPESLKGYRYRNIFETTLKEIRGNKSWYPIFVKPLEKHKAFTGHVIREFKDLIQTASIDENIQILAQEEVKFFSEWRAFVLNGEMIGLRHYKGDVDWFPDVDKINEMMINFKGSPIAYSLDVGDIDEIKGITALVEVNDAFSLGSYGLPSHLYTDMIERRWIEMVVNT